jgi:hypothetical protein
VSEVGLGHVFHACCPGRFSTTVTHSMRRATVVAEHIHWCAQAALGAKVWVVVLTHSRKRGLCIRSCCVAATSLGGVTSSSLQSPTNPVSACVLTESCRYSPVSVLTESC